MARRERFYQSSGYQGLSFIASETRVHQTINHKLHDKPSSNTSNDATRHAVLMPRKSPTLLALNTEIARPSISTQA